MRLAPAPLLVCSDASNSAEAAVSTPIGPHFTGEAHRYALQKGMWNRLLSPGKAYLREHNLLPADQELPAEDDSLEMHPLWHEVVTSQPFSQLGTTKRDGRRKHINVREVRAALSAERDMGFRYPNSFYIHLQDSQVSLACMVKGRSSSPQLNQLLRESIPFHAGCNIHGFYGYCRSKANPADDPTRDAALRPPTRAEPSWLSEAKRGQFSGMDEFLEQQGNSLLHLAGLPSEEELWADVKIDGSTSKSRRSLRGKALGEFKKQEKKETAQHLSDASGEGFTVAEVRSSVEGLEIDAEFNDSEPSSSPESSSTPGPSAALGANSDRHGAKQHAAAYNKKARDGLSQGLVERLLRFREDQFVFSKDYANIREALAAGPGVLDLYSGARGFSRAFVNLNGGWAICFDIAHHSSENLLDPRLQSDLLGLLRDGAFLAMACSPVCASYSTAITPPGMHPMGIPSLAELQRAKVEVGHLQLSFTLKLVRQCLKSGVLFWIEHPDSSWFWRMPGELSWEPLMSSGVIADYRTDQCRWGTAWRKRTRFRTNSHIKGQSTFCRCKCKHVVLRGRCPDRKMNFTKLAESYPRKLCHGLAACFGVELGLQPHRRKVCMADIAFCKQRNIGEAANPGPRRARQRPHRSINLEDVKALQPGTIAMRRRFWNDFVAWMYREGGQELLHHCQQAPVLMVQALKSYGSFLFAAGTPLHYFRQLLAHIQREFPLTKQFMHIAWAMVTKWELCEPVQHRPPMPEALVEAMVSLAIVWKWDFFAGATLTCFHGMSRIGEVLSAKRSHLLTPVDLLETSQVLYLLIEKPKSRGRGPRVQYTTVRESAAVGFISKIWQNTPRDRPLYPSSPSNYRRRWDALLAAIGVQKWHRLTPGSLRGGGCVAAHRKGCHIQDLCWRMRLAHTRTLTFYLQETTAVSILPALTEDTRDNILVLRSLLPFLLENAPRRAAFT